MNIEKILQELTVEEKAALCSGLDFWHTKPNERLDIPSVMVSDGPHGLRKNIENAENPNQAITAVCFPTACASACPRTSSNADWPTPCLTVKPSRTSLQCWPLPTNSKMSR